MTATTTATGNSQVLTLRWYVGGAVTVDATWLAFHPLSQGSGTTTSTSTSTGTTTKGGSKNSGEGKNEGASSSSSSSTSTTTMTKEQAVAALVSGTAEERGSLFIPIYS